MLPKKRTTKPFKWGTQRRLLPLGDVTAYELFTVPVPEMREACLGHMNSRVLVPKEVSYDASPIITYGEA